ncbi:UDP-2,4-diacetamido-2,4,6-trideoxy-beta-L-altropyranose hydrolase [Pseudomonas oryzihabitans]|nr:UDP-2,4-diacetamido-2,4,6-trideoxy-beta-L-altropyranose hydrolase [Pseudomonas psychrotolerans]
MRVLIRADASLRIGSGHIVRCLTLADALAAVGCQIHFACRTEPGHAVAQIAARGYPVHRLSAPDRRDDPESSLPWAEDMVSLDQALPGDLDFDWCVVDHYGLGTEWERAIRSRARRVLAIDDLPQRVHAVDLLLDQNMTAAVRAESMLSEVGQALFGPRFALLRPAFQTATASTRSVVERVLVNFGGVDASGETFKVLEALEAFPTLHVDIIAGSANPAFDRLQQRTASHPHWCLQRHADDFAVLMAAADLCIGAGGASTWERAALGRATLCVALAPNQRGNALALAEHGAHLYLGDAETLSAADYRAAMHTLMVSGGLRSSLSVRSRELVDGRGTARVLTAMLGQDLRLRPATWNDAQLLYDGRNAEMVRRASLNMDPLCWEDHLGWLSRTLADTERQLLLIASALGGPVGVIRFQRLSERVAEVSLYLLVDRLGAGWGLPLLQAGETYLAGHWPTVEEVEAQVRDDNPASQQLFQRAGYQPRLHQLYRPLRGDRR